MESRTASAQWGLNRKFRLLTFEDEKSDNQKFRLLTFEDEKSDNQKFRLQFSEDKLVYTNAG